MRHLSSLKTMSWVTQLVMIGVTIGQCLLLSVHRGNVIGLDAGLLAKLSERHFSGVVRVEGKSRSADWQPA